MIELHFSCSENHHDRFARTTSSCMKKLKSPTIASTTAKIRISVAAMISSSRAGGLGIPSVLK
jgi:hypothetical protein